MFWHDFRQKIFFDEKCAVLHDEDESKIKDLAYRAYHALDVSGWGRVDVMQDEHGAFYLLLSQYEKQSIKGHNGLKMRRFEFKANRNDAI